MTKRTCVLCDDPHDARGYCRRHYKLWMKYGDPLYEFAPPPGGLRRYTLNEAYFDEISTPEKAYWLGFITADGSIKRSGRTTALRFSLAEYDGSHVQLLARTMGSDKTPWQKRGCVGVDLDSRYLTESLGRLGIVPRKSAIVEPWNGPAALMPHYWRGLFDGDGSIGVNCRGTWTMNICGSSACVDAFANWARAVCASRASVFSYRNAPDCWGWTVGGTRKTRLLARALYAEADVALPRKHELARRLIAG